MEPTAQAAEPVVAPAEPENDLAEGEVEENPELEHMLASFDQIMQARQDVVECEKEESRTKKLHASAKAALEKAWLRLGDVIDEQKKGMEPNLFNSGFEKPKEGESWREVFIGSIGLPDALSEKLIEADINSVGKLADFSNSGKMLTDIPGVGAAKAEQINDALTAFWEKRNNAAAAAKAATEAAAKTVENQKARKEPGAEKKAKDDAIIAAGLAAMGVQPVGTVPG